MKHVALKILVLMTAIAVTPVFNSVALAIELPSSHLVTYSRIWGADRYATMQNLTFAAYGAGSTHAVVVRGDNFPDALAAASYAGLMDCPLVLTPSELLSKDTLITLLSLRVDGVDIVGGTGAVSEVAAAQMRAFGISVNRISGEDRYATAYNVYTAGSALWSKDCAIITTGGDFADALSISPYANAANAPIFLAASDGSLDALSLAAAQTFEHILIVGGTGAVSATTEGLLSDNQVVRLGGATAYDTSVEIASWLTGGKPEAVFPPSPSVAFSWEGTAFATRTTFPDALSGSVLQGRTRAPLLLVDDTDNAEGVFELVSNVLSQEDIGLRFFGGEGVVSAAVVDRIVGMWDNAATRPWTYSGELTSVPDTTYLLNYRAAKAGVALENESFDQLVLVDSSGTAATLYCYERNTSGVFDQTTFVSTAQGFVGRDGVGAASEYVSATPAGLFSLDFAFGVQPAPLTTSMVYHQATSDSYWVDDPDSDYYNTWQEGEDNKDWSSAEYLKGSPTAYAYGVVIGYNHPSYLVSEGAIPGAGSAIFLHCSTGYPTAGCVSIPRSSMLEVLAWLDPALEPHILIV